MGVVFEARQVSLNRPVALKMILAGQLADETDVKRFYAEAEAAANLDHPGIVPIYEVGEHAGQHYFSMGFVAGASLSQRLAEGPLPAREAASLLLKVAEAIEFAHRRGVIHRDLKPANILLDANGNPRVTDFGLAKKIEGDSGLTGSGQIMGTPSYMPPEQAGGNRGEIAPATDVYALGATLYALVTGRPPFQAANAMDTVLQVISDDPVPPRRLNPLIPRDLETICLKCLEKVPARRYPSALALAEELRRYLAGEPILARPIGPLERARKWARRRPPAAALVVVSSLAAISLAISGFVYSNQLRRFNSSLEAAYNDVKRERDEADKERQRALIQEQVATRQEALTRRSLYAEHMNLAQQAWESDNVTRVLALLNQHRAEPGREDIRGFEWYHLWHLSHAVRRTLGDHQNVVTSVAYSPDGKLLATAGMDRTVKLRDPLNGSVLKDLPGITEPVRSIVFSPDCKSLLVVAGKGIKLWDLATNRERAAMPPQSRMITCAAFSPDSSSIAVGGLGPNVSLWTPSDGKIATLTGKGGWVYSLAFSPDGKSLASGGAFEGAAQLIVWNIASGEKHALKRRVDPGSSSLLPPEDLRTTHFLVGLGTVFSVAFSPDGRLLGGGFGNSPDTGHGEFVARLWDVGTGQERATLTGHDQAVMSLSFSPDGKTLETAGLDATLRLWDVETARSKAVLRGHTSGIVSSAFAPDGQTLATASLDRTVKLWDATPERERDTLYRGREFGASALAFSSDSRVLAVGSVDGMTRLWDVATSRPSGVLEGSLQASVLAVAIAPDNLSLVAGCNDHRIRLWDLKTRRLLNTVEGHGDAIACAAFSPDGAILATGSEDHSVILWDVPAFRRRELLRGHANGITCLAFSPDGKTLAVASGSRIDPHDPARDLKLWDVASAKEFASLGAPASPVTSLAFSPDGQVLAVACNQPDSVAQLWDVERRQIITRLTGHKGTVSSLAFSPDNKTMATAGSDAFVKLWDPITGQERATLKGHTGPLTSLAFSRDNKVLASAGGASTPDIIQPGEVILWRADVAEWLPDRSAP